MHMVYKTSYLHASCLVPYNASMYRFLWHLICTLYAKWFVCIVPKTNQGGPFVFGLHTNVHMYKSFVHRFPLPSCTIPTAIPAIPAMIPNAWNALEHAFVGSCSQWLNHQHTIRAMLSFASMLCQQKNQLPFLIAPLPVYDNNSPDGAIRNGSCFFLLSEHWSKAHHCHEIFAMYKCILYMLYGTCPHNDEQPTVHTSQVERYVCVQFTKVCFVHCMHCKEWPKGTQTQDTPTIPYAVYSIQITLLW